MVTPNYNSSWGKLRSKDISLLTSKNGGFLRRKKGESRWLRTREKIVSEMAANIFITKLFIMVNIV